MECPNCGTAVPDGTFECPSCHFQLGLTQRIPVASGMWCPVCGALLADGMSVCPKCGTPIDDSATPTHAVRDLDLPEIDRAPSAGAGEDSDLDSTSALLQAYAKSREPRIESAIPAEQDPSSTVLRHDRMPRTRVFVFAALFAIAVIGGAALAITHPWDPTLYKTSATTPADTSSAGFPGTLTTLTGQDSSSETTSSSTDAVYQAILADYTTLGELEAKLDACVTTFDETAYTGDASSRASASSDASSLSIKISNLISDISQLDNGAGTYSDDLANLVKLGNWLRNRADALTDAWTLDVGYDNPSEHRSEIEAVAKRNYAGGTDSFKKQFDENYDAWKPTQK